MRISIIWTWYIWLIQAVWLAKLWFNVTSLDVFQDKIDKLNSWIPPIYEDGLQDLLLETKENITFTTDKSKIIGSDIIFLCVGTPQNEEWKTDLWYVFWACNDLKSYLNGSEIIVIKSTVPVGTNKKIYELFEKKNKVVSNPEFLREWLAIHDFFSPDRIVFWFDDLEDVVLIDKIKQLYSFFIKKEVPIFTTDWQTAELIKYAANSFLATKITFINEIAKLSDKVGANIKDISIAIGMDDRIWSKFLNAGIGYWWSCFPKDVKSLIHQFRENNLIWEIITKVDETNSLQVQYFLDKIFKYYGNDLHGKTISVLWVAFKPGTDDLRDSKWIEIIKKLMYAWARLKIFDYNPGALNNFKKYLEWIILANSRWFFEIDIVDNFNDLIKWADTLVIALEDKKILDEDWNKVHLKDEVIFDGKNILNKKKIQALRISYIWIWC